MDHKKVADNVFLFAAKENKREYFDFGGFVQ